LVSLTNYRKRLDTMPSHALSDVKEMSKAERLISYSLLSLITSKPLAAAPTTGISEDDGTYNVKGRGLTNKEGAWCWREGCEGEQI
jgi:hypothetical protein